MDFFIQWLCYLAAFVTGSAVAWIIVTVSLGTGEERKSQPEAAPAADAAPAVDAADALDAADAAPAEDETDLLTAPIDAEPETEVLPGLADEVDTAVLPASSEVDKS
ncbi:hypothetical protein BST27_10935 [Mycobacterium intermedium]|uniref:Uncharacterized protein n=1 Tax=Mycobacterium intermedium TaxID=28445 RepID=A0A1E3S8Z6_MYCIE|nr:hypothetical protein [Mycobacterium intermedium]MCV6967824.1 hypothetical protein [Mycobacterium intermedium]ODQ98645.1 hypothetical protein BHQ20_20855 [Mycobacterium intermedium]OPE50831.1 hypothetical protein BV508_08665 [Mycobacterium intermedium]ORB06590.1 hypothetical protein BST27_10935 [Mycobacterium intermedium]